MNVEVSGSTPPSGPNPELVSVLESAQNFALRLRDERVQDTHLLWALLGSPAVSSKDNEFASAGVRKNTVFLAIKATFGEGTKKDKRSAPFAPEARVLYDSTIDQATKAGRLAEPKDLLSNLLQNPSLATMMVLNTVVQNHLSTNGTPNLARARTEIWMHDLAERELIEVAPQSTKPRSQTDAFLRSMSMRLEVA